MVFRRTATAERDFSAHARLVLVAISTRERRSASASRAALLANQVSLSALTSYVLGQRVSLVVPARLEELGLGTLARELEQQVAARRQQALADAKVRCVLTDGVVRRLEEVGIPAISLKGVDLSHRLYGNSASRESRDIDVLVLPQHLERAAALAQREFSYAPPLDAVGPDGWPLLHYRMENPHGWPSLELHWRVHWYECASGTHMLRRSAMTAGQRVMTPVDELASLLLFYARDGFVGIRDLAAIAAWWDRHGTALSPSGLADFANAFPQLVPALRASAAVAAELAGLPLAPLKLDVHRATLRERRAAQLADPQPGSDTSRLLADVALVDLLLAPTLDLRAFARRQMLLDATFTRTLNAAPHGRGGPERRVLWDRVLWRAARMTSALATARPSGLDSLREPPAEHESALTRAVTSHSASNRVTRAGT